MLEEVKVEKCIYSLFIHIRFVVKLKIKAYLDFSFYFINIHWSLRFFFKRKALSVKYLH